MHGFFIYWNKKTYFNFSDSFRNIDSLEYMRKTQNTDKSITLIQLETIFYLLLIGLSISILIIIIEIFVYFWVKIYLYSSLKYLNII